MISKIPKTTKNGVFVTSLIVIGGTWAYISLGMRGYARFQRWSFFAGGLSFLVFVILMLVNSKANFISSFNREAHDLYGAHAGAYQATLKSSGYANPGLLTFHAGDTFLMIGFIAFALVFLITRDREHEEA